MIHRSATGGGASRPVRDGLPKGSKAHFTGGPIPMVGIYIIHLVGQLASVLNGAAALVGGLL